MVQIRLSEQEAVAVAAMEAAQGVKAPALFMRALLTGGTEAAAEFEQLRDELGAASRLLAAMGANVNQLARQANAAGGGVDVEPVTADQLAGVMRAVARSLEGIDAVTARAAARSAQAAATNGVAVATDAGTAGTGGHGAATAARGAATGGRRARAGGAR